jgi:SAM-dependent methyltransferase
MPILLRREYRLTAFLDWTRDVATGRVHPSRATLREALRRRRRERPPRRYAFAERYLAGLEGVEVGGSAANAFNVKAFNFDRYPSMATVYKEAERRFADRALPVDVAAHGDALPLRDGAVDFVLASHVIEHFPDPIRALREWVRVARRYVFLVVPHRDRTFDRDRPLTPLDELLERHGKGFTSSEDRHWSVWTCESFVEMCGRLGLAVLATEDPDRRTGDGFALIIDARRSRFSPGP